MDQKLIKDLEKKKFMFDLNDFNEEYIEEEELEEEPPPTFSEEELQAAIQEAKAQGFQDGKMQGIQETKESIEQAVANTLERMAADMAILYNAEHERESLYEQESVQLAYILFNKLFPILEEKLGPEEFEKHLLSTLEKTHGQNNIQINVHPDIENAVKELILQIKNPHTHPEKLVVKADTSLGAYDYKISWDDGGAVRNRSEISEEIGTIMSEALAQEPVNVHDSDINGQNQAESINELNEIQQEVSKPEQIPQAPQDNQSVIPEENAATSSSEDVHMEAPSAPEETTQENSDEDSIPAQTEQNLQEAQTEPEITQETADTAEDTTIEDDIEPEAVKKDTPPSQIEDL